MLVTEFSRLGRRRSETPALVEAITEAGVSIYAHNLGLETLLANGKRNPVASIVIAVMIEIDAMETERLSERTYLDWRRPVVMASSWVAPKARLKRTTV